VPDRSPGRRIRRRAAGPPWAIPGGTVVKTLYLLRHGKSSWKDRSLADPDRPLNDRGRRAAALMGDYLRREAIQPRLILCSAARRARETLVGLEAMTGDGGVPTLIEEALYMSDPEDLLLRLNRVEDSVPSVMVIGHNPGLQELALTLVGDGGDLGRRIAIKYPTAALAVFTAAVSRWQDLRSGGARLERFIRPKDLQAAGNF